MIKQKSTLLLVFLLFCGLAHSVNVPSAIKAIYIDWHLDWNNPQQSVLDAVDSGYNVIIISFYLSDGSVADMAQAWAGLADSVKQDTVQKVHDKGAVITVSLGGATDSPFGKDPNSLGQQVGAWAKAQYLDGVDFDLEGLAAGFTAGGKSADDTVNWIADVTKAASDALGGGIISHAPQAPYFGPIGSTSTWAGPSGGYSGVYQKVPDAISFFNIQFYNQGASCYTDYNGLFVSSGASCPVFPETAVAEIIKSGIPANKVVVGKPVTTADASNGFVSGQDLHTMFEQAKSELQWDAGVMGWVWNDKATLAAWINAIYPGGGSNTDGSNTGSTTGGSTSGNPTTGGSTTGSSSTGGGCSGKAEGMYCVDSTHFEWCPQGTVQQCAPGTSCVQVGNSIQCS